MQGKTREQDRQGCRALNCTNHSRDLIDVKLGHAKETRLPRRDEQLRLPKSNKPTRRWNCKAEQRDKLELRSRQGKRYEKLAENPLGRSDRGGKKNRQQQQATTSGIGRAHWSSLLSKRQWQEGWCSGGAEKQITSVPHTTGSAGNVLVSLSIVVLYQWVAVHSVDHLVTFRLLTGTC